MNENLNTKVNLNDNNDSDFLTNDNSSSNTSKFLTNRPLNKPISNYIDFLKFIIYLYSCDIENNNDEFIAEISKLVDAPLELIQAFIPQLIGFYIIHARVYP